MSFASMYLLRGLNVAMPQKAAMIIEKIPMYEPSVASNNATTRLITQQNASNLPREFNVLHGAIMRQAIFFQTVQSKPLEQLISTCHVYWNMGWFGIFQQALLQNQSQVSPRV